MLICNFLIAVSDRIVCVLRPLSYHDLVHLEEIMAPVLNNMTIIQMLECNFIHYTQTKPVNENNDYIRCFIK